MKITIRDRAKPAFAGGHVHNDTAWIDRDGDLWVVDFYGEVTIIKTTGKTVVGSARNTLNKLYAPYREVLLTEIIVEPVL